MIEIYLMIFCAFIIAFIIFCSIERILSGEWYITTISRLEEENKKLKKELRKCANNWKQEIVERGKLEEENEHLKERVMILEKLISDVETSERMSIDNLIDTEMIDDE